MAPDKKRLMWVLLMIAFFFLNLIALAIFFLWPPHK